MNGPTRVLIVDDSAFARKVLRDILSAESDIEVVGIARDGYDALDKVVELRPDVVTLDLMMPELDGVGVLHALGGADRPRVVAVTMADEQSEMGVAALAAGAIDVVHKPTAIATDRLYELGAELVRKVRAADTARPPSRSAMTQTLVTAPSADRSVDVVVVGASTGGPQAIARILGALPAEFSVPLAVVIHMPVGYTQPYADRVDHESALSVMEARDGLVLLSHMAVIARAGIHLRLSRGLTGPEVVLASTPFDTLHRPSVDVLFTSAAEAYADRVLGIVLTGMGSDGLAGATAIREHGGRVIVEAASSCVVYGMPRVVAEAGLANAEAPLDRMAEVIVQGVTSVST